MLRDRSDAMVGSAAIGGDYPLDPDDTITLEALVPSTADPASADMIAYGDNAPRVPIPGPIVR
jgi:hypothetical protein